MPELNNYIFLSYAREDKEIAKRIYQDLRRRSIEVWYDQESLLPGHKWKNEIKTAIRKSSYFLVLLSSNSVNKRGYVQKELKEALDVFDEFPSSEVFIIPIRLDDCEISEDRIKELQITDLYDSYESGLEKIISVIRSNMLGAVQLLSLASKPEVVSLGDSITLHFNIDSISSSVSSIWLGASMVHSVTGKEIWNVVQDKNIDLKEGQYEYTRELTVREDAPLGEYILYGSVWLGKCGNVSKSYRLITINSEQRITVVSSK